MVRVALVSVVALLVPLSLHGCGGGDSPEAKTTTKAMTTTSDGIQPQYAYTAWSAPIKDGTCSETAEATDIEIASKDAGKDVIKCALVGGVKSYSFPVGIFEIDEQLLIPEKTSIIGAQNPNDMANPTKSPKWSEQTLFLATRGATEYYPAYCKAKDMVTTRVGFVLSSYVSMRDLCYQGVDTIRPNDNGALCGGGVFETKGCAENDCKASDVNNGGSDGMGSLDVTIENVRLNDYYYEEDKALVGAAVEGNTNCTTTDWDNQCCFCKPNGVRSTQQGVWVPQSRGDGTRNLFVNNVVSMSNQADAINLHGNIYDSVVQNAWFENTGDDMYVLWGADNDPTNITFKDSVAVNPGILRPNWYGNCVATYGLKQVVFENITCRSPTLDKPILAPGDGSQRMDTSMYVFYTSFGGQYADGNNLTLKGSNFEDLDGNAYTVEDGVMDVHKPGKMVWTKSDNNKGAAVDPYYLVPPTIQQVNVYVVSNPAVSEVLVLTDTEVITSTAWTIGGIGFIGLAAFVAAASQLRAQSPAVAGTVEMSERC